MSDPIMTGRCLGCRRRVRVLPVPKLVAAKRGLTRCAELATHYIDGWACRGSGSDLFLTGISLEV